MSPKYVLENSRQGGRLVSVAEGERDQSRWARPISWKLKQDTGQDFEAFSLCYGCLAEGNHRAFSQLYVSNSSPWEPPWKDPRGAETPF